MELITKEDVLKKLADTLLKIKTLQKQSLNISCIKQLMLKQKNNDYICEIHKVLIGSYFKDKARLN